MKRLAVCLYARVLAGVLCLGLAVGCTTVAAPYGQRFDRPALDAMLAPIALYPDRLLSHVLMAATYPAEVEEAARWLRDRPGLSGDAAVRTAEGWDWDPSVRSLLAFPHVLDTLADHIRWTADVGDAFLHQREEVMDVIQFLRRRAYEAGTLRSNEAIRVVDTGYAIEILSAPAQTVYVPYYDPRVVYGSWWWPARPPMYWSSWPDYYVPHAAPSPFLWGPGIHVSGGFFFGDFAWARREVRVVDVRPYYYPRRIVVERHVVPGYPGHRVEHRPAAPGVWQHDSRRRLSDEARAARRANEPRRLEGDRDARRVERRDDRPGDWRNDRRDGQPPGRVVAPNDPSDSREQGGRARRPVRSDEDRASAIDRVERRQGAPNVRPDPRVRPDAGQTGNRDLRGRDDGDRRSSSQQRFDRADGAPPGRAMEAPARAAPPITRPQSNALAAPGQPGNRERGVRDDARANVPQRSELREPPSPARAMQAPAPAAAPQVARPLPNDPSDSRQQGNPRGSRGSRGRDHGD